MHHLGFFLFKHQAPSWPSNLHFYHCSQFCIVQMRYTKRCALLKFKIWNDKSRACVVGYLLMRSLSQRLFVCFLAGQLVGVFWRRYPSFDLHFAFWFWNLGSFGLTFEPEATLLPGNNIIIRMSSCRCVLGLFALSLSCQESWLSRCDSLCWCFGVPFSCLIYILHLVLEPWSHCYSPNLCLMF